MADDALTASQQEALALGWRSSGQGGASPEAMAPDAPMEVGPALCRVGN
jgi:hypothetical protein